jgi:transcriptional regulator with XRE-family HTH domain
VSQEALAFETGINRSYLSKLEKGASFVGLEVITKLANVLHTEPAELLMRPAKTTRTASDARRAGDR